MKQSTLYAIISFLFDNNMMLCWIWWWSGFQKATLLTITANRLLVKESYSNKGHSHIGSRLICSLKVVPSKAATAHWAPSMCRHCPRSCASAVPLTSLILWHHDNHMGKPSLGIFSTCQIHTATQKVESKSKSRSFLPPEPTLLHRW